MTNAWSLSRRCALTAFFATFFLAAQETTKWDEHFQQAAQAFEAGRYAQAIDSLTAALQDAVAFPTSLTKASLTFVPSWFARPIVL